jgi:hypothetical protein
MNRGIYDIVVPGEPIQITDGNGSLTTELEEKTLLFATGTAAVSGDNSIIASPGASQEIVIVAIQIQNESLNETLAILKFGSTAKWRILAKEKGVGFVIPIPNGYAWHVGANTAVVLNLNGANQFGYNIIYYTKAV